MSRAWLILLLAAAACTRVELELDGLACGAGGRCVEGYVCSEANVCVREGAGDADAVVDEDPPPADGDGAADAETPDLDPGDGDGDGDTMPDLCAGSPDVDGDGVCAALDCDDTVPTCTSDCTTDSDDAGEASPQADCLELYCGAVPTDPTSSCVVAETLAELLAALAAAEATAGTDHILLGDISLDGALTLGQEDVVLRQRRGSVVRATATANEGFVISGARYRLSGLTLDAQGNVKDGVKITGSDVVVEDVHILRTKETGLYIDGGVRPRLLRNLVSGVASAPGNERGGIVLRDVTDAVVLGNVVAHNGGDGVQLRNATATILDHNTIAANGGNGVLFYAAASSGTCARHNDVSENGLAGVAAAIGGNTWSVSAGCTGGLGPNVDYGNNHSGNTSTCGGADCASCGCLPSASFWRGSASPEYRSTDLALPGFFCAAAAQLVDQGIDLGFDLNGEDAGLYLGDGPDVGAGDAACR